MLLRNISSFGQFEQTTLENVFVANDMLYIRPTLQDENLVENNNVIDLRSIGCTGQTWVDCMATTNTTNGTIVNPVKSGRINTKLGASIQFGRVEVVAKLPAGDWLWPSIMMLPSDDTYGGWPRSGQIDIVQSRGNDWKYKQGGNDVVSSTLHFGPNEENDGWWRNNVKRAALHTTYSTGFHTFGVEVSLFALSSILRVLMPCSGPRSISSHTLTPDYFKLVSHILTYLFGNTVGSLLRAPTAQASKILGATQAVKPHHSIRNSISLSNSEWVLRMAGLRTGNLGSRGSTPNPEPGASSGMLATYGILPGKSKAGWRLEV